MDVSIFNGFALTAAKFSFWHQLNFLSDIGFKLFFSSI